ncbi:unnamed protein product [Rhodiola kirilowii]
MVEGTLGMAKLTMGVRKLVRISGCLEWQSLSEKFDSS